jgi:hypothetical protein
MLGYVVLSLSRITILATEPVECVYDMRQGVA